MTTQDNLQEADGLLEEKNKEQKEKTPAKDAVDQACLLYTSPSPRD